MQSMSNQWLKILWSIDEGKRRNELAEWQVAWLVERHNYAAFNLWKMAQRNKLNTKACARLCRVPFGATFEGAIARLKLKHS